MKNLKKIFATVLIAGAASFTFAAPAHADSLSIGLNLGDGYRYRPAPAPVQRVVYEPVYRPAPRPVRVTYYDTYYGRPYYRHAWVRPGWQHGHREAYGYGHWDDHDRGHR